METGQELVNAEIAVRTRDTPTSMQYENTAPTEYFQRYSQSKVLVKPIWFNKKILSSLDIRLISQFEGQMQSYRKQIEQTEQHLQVKTSDTFCNLLKSNLFRCSVPAPLSPPRTLWPPFRSFTLPSPTSPPSTRGCTRRWQCRKLHIDNCIGHCTELHLFLRRRKP